MIAQKVASATQDGAIGPKTIAAIEAVIDTKGADAFITNYSEERELFLRSLPTFDTFGRGWVRRVDEVEAYASILAMQEVA